MATDIVPEELEKLARTRGVKFDWFDVCRDALVPILNPANPVSALTLKQLSDIYRGAILNWKDVGGSDASIHVLSHEGTSGTYETFKQAVLGDSAVITPSARMLSHQGVLDLVAKDPDAIGYIGMHGRAP